ncbi:MAG TPA: hypothetical protein VF510_26725 [Ktedonobacterales bacterium]
MASEVAVVGVVDSVAGSVAASDIIVVEPVCYFELWMSLHDQSGNDEEEGAIVYTV